jgi:natural product biosynthesis luciferase-like monooxygenase protein
MSDGNDRLAKLTPEQRRLLEIRLRERGLAGAVPPAGEARAADAGGTASSSTGAGFAAEEPEAPDAWRARPPDRKVAFSLYFFSDDGSRENGEKYRLAIESARFADAHAFTAVWTPERHFQAFGGLYPNPSVLGAALAAVTSRVGIRAGSVALPLHNPVRVAEEWSVVDNLSNGRVAVSFASGWHPDDFVLYPSPYAERKDVMLRGIETIRRLWAGEAVTMPGPEGPVEVRTLPRPVQKSLPVWVTTAGSGETWERAGAIGANILAALVGYGPDDLTAQIGRYRRARAQAGHDPGAGIVTLVAHAYVGSDDREVRALVREPMTDYLQTYLRQFRKEGSPGTAGTGPSERDAREVAGLAFEHYYGTSTLLGTAGKCARVVEAIAACGAKEVACLVDFGLETETVLEALPRLAELARHFSGEAAVSGAGRPAPTHTSSKHPSNIPKAADTMRDGASARAAAPDGGSD